MGITPDQAMDILSDGALEEAKINLARQSYPKEFNAILEISRRFNAEIIRAGWTCIVRTQFGGFTIDGIDRSDAEDRRSLFLHEIRHLI